jgi:hypothetical protein
MEDGGEARPLFDVLFIDNVGFVESCLWPGAWVIINLGNNGRPNRGRFVNDG